MNENNFFYTLDKIDDEFIKEAAGNGAVKPDFTRSPKKSRKPLFAILGAAASFAVVFSVGIALKNNVSPYNPNNTNPYSTQETVTEAETIIIEHRTEKTETDTPAETERQTVEMTDESGIKFTLYGEPVFTDNLAYFDYEEEYQYIMSKGSEDMNFFKGIDIPDKEEIIRLYFRGKTLKSIAGNTASGIMREHGFTNAQIRIPNEEGFRVYFETGISFDSYVEALSDVFTEDTVKVFMNNPEDHVCPFGYNGEVWTMIGDRFPNLSLCHEEYFITKSTDTEFRFTTIMYFKNQYPYRYTEEDVNDLSESNDWCMISTTENIFLKTENGWRIKDLCTEYGSLVNESEDIEKVFNRMYEYESLEERYYNEGTVMPLPSNWTEETAAAAWERFYMAELNKTIDERTEYYSNRNYLDRVFFDFNGDGRAEVMFTDPYGNICLLDDNQEILLRRSHPWPREIYVPSAVTDSAELERMGADYEENENIYKSRELKILTDKNGKFYFIAACFDLNHWKYYLYEISKEKETVVPAYKWGEFPEQIGSELVYETEYIKFTDDAETKITQQELEAFMAALKPAE